MTTDIIALAMQKGGVGKTASTINLGAVAADRGKRVLLVDFDPQASLSLLCGAYPDDGQPTLYDTFHAGRPFDVRPLLVRLPTGETLLPGTLDLSVLEVELPAVMRAEYVLQEALEPLADDYDVILIDCPPSFGKLTINALAAADRVLIPCIPDFVSVQGLKRLGETITQIRQSRVNPALRYAGLFMTRVDSRTHLHQEWTASVRDGFCRAQRCPFLGVVPETIRVAEAGGAGVAITRYPNGSGAKAAAAYEALADQLWGPANAC